MAFPDVVKTGSQMGAERLVVIGGGLAGCEAAWQAAERGVQVSLYERKPMERSSAHQSDDLAELVCSNSLRGDSLGNAVGLLKHEMRRLSSLILRAADETAVPAGRALAVDRDAFSRSITRAISSHPRIRLHCERVAKIPDDPFVVLATGPLTSPDLAAEIQALVGEEQLYFYDAIAPTIHADSIDTGVVFRASRYQDGEGDYLNVPLDGDQYRGFVDALLAAEPVPLHECEAALFFEGCLPIEEMAKRGRDTLAFGPLKPVGLVDPRTGRRPHAVMQLRREDREGVLYNLVGCQTKLRVDDQKRIFRMLPGLGDAVFARFGSVHRNTYVNAPVCLGDTLEVRGRPGLYLAGQMTGVEGYVESAALGFVAGVNAACSLLGEIACPPPRATAHGSLLAHLRNTGAKDFQPMNINYGLFPALPETERRLRKREKNERLAERALAELEPWAHAIGAPGP